MSPLDVLRTALSSLGGNRLRAGLTLLGIVIGISAVISLLAIGRGVQQGITSRFEALGTNVLFVQPDAGGGGESTLTLEDAYALVDPVFAPSVEAVAPEIRASVRVSAGRNDTNTQVIGTTSEYQTVRNVEVALGGFISTAHVVNRSEVAVLGFPVAEDLFGLRDPVGQQIRINGRQFTVIGVLEDSGGTAFGQSGNQVIVPVTTAYYRLTSQRTTQGEIAVQSINVQAVSRDVMEQAETEISTVLRLRHRITDEEDFIVTSQSNIIETLEETTETLVIFLGVIAGISLLVGGIGVMNIMLVSVTERTREIGIRKAVGAKRRDILLQFVAEATILSLGGGALGVLLGLLLTRLLDGTTLIGTQPIETGFSGDIAVIALVVSAGIGLFFGIYPAMRAARMHPIEALRHE